MKLQNINLSFNLDVIYDDISLYVPEGHKIGVIGVNGAGKTTLFKVLMKKISLDSGRIILENNARVGYLPQVIEFDELDETVFSYLLKGRPIESLEKELQESYESLTEVDVDKYDFIYKKIDKIQAKLEYWEHYSAENTLLKILAGMQIKDSLLDRPLHELSGGEKSKIAFARILYEKPEILLLDEPTNHLDIDSKEYIIDYLKNYNGSIYVISHDIDFLNQITNKTLFLDKRIKKMELFDGNYKKFKKVYEAREEAKLRQFEIEQKEEDKLKAIVELYDNSSGKRKKMAQDREKKLEKLQANRTVIIKKQKQTKLIMEVSQESNLVPLRVEKITFAYENENYLYQNLSFELAKKEKFLIVGENGIGKSTLLKLIINELEPQEGIIYYGPKTEIAYYAQEHENLNLEYNLLEHFSDTDLSQKQIRTILGKFLFYGDDVYKKVKVLSPGERARLSLAKLTTKKANVLILDEPTNHLDPETQKIVGEVLKTYLGTMLVVSHNPEFVDSLGIDRILKLPEGNILYYERKLVEYYSDKNNR